MTALKFLGIDYGTKRIGIAVSDEGGRLAFPREILANNVDTLKKLSEILKKENISKIVVGESTDFSGKQNAISAKIEIFISELGTRFKLPIHTEKEFLTSVEARKWKSGRSNVNRSQAHTRMKQVKSPKVDASAAALMLQRYLDKINK